MVGPAPAVEQVWLAVDAAAGRHPGPGDDRPVAARRFDALHALVLGTAPSSSGSTSGENESDAQAGGEPLPRLRAGRIEVGLVMNLPTALGLADNPAELVGYGPLPAALARALAADADWRRLLVEEATGYLLDYDRATYRPPKALADYLAARDRTCVFPGCSQPAWRCDIDHAQTWTCGGHTCAGNCGLFCRPHHQLKTAGLWRFQRHPDGTGTLTSPAGHTYDIEPHRYPRRLHPATNPSCSASPHQSPTPHRDHRCPTTHRSEAAGAERSAAAAA